MCCVCDFTAFLVAIKSVLFSCYCVDWTVGLFLLSISGRDRREGVEKVQAVSRLVRVSKVVVRAARICFVKIDLHSFI